MHPMLMIQAPPGLLYLNGRFCGETGGSGLPLSRDGVAYLEYRPLGSQEPGMALRLTLRAGNLEDGLAEDAYAVQWPSGLIELELRAQTPALESLLHQHLDTPLGRLLLYETEGRLLLGFDGTDATALPVDGPFADVQLRTQPHPTQPLIAVTGKGGQGTFTTVLRLDRPPQLLQSIQGRPAEWAPDGSLRTTRPLPADVARAWLDAVQNNAHQEAAQYLAQPALQERMAREVGNFDQVVPLKQPIPGLAPVEWGLLTLTQPQVAQVRALGFVLRPAEDAWRIDRVIPY